MVDHTGQMLAETVEQFVARQAALRHQTVGLIAAERTGEIARRDLLVGAGAHPGIGGVAMAALLELLEQVAEPAADHAAGSAAREQAAQPTLEEIAKTAAETSTTKTSTTNASTHSAPRGRGGGRRRCVALAAADMLDRLVGQRGQDRHGHRRHSAAGLRGRIAGPARAVLHAVEYIE